MRAHQIMTRPVITVLPDATIVEAVNFDAAAAREWAAGGRRGRKAGRHCLGERSSFAAMKSAPSANAAGF